MVQTKGLAAASPLTVSAITKILRWIEPEFRTTALCVCFGLAAALLVWSFERTQSAYFFKNALRIELVFQTLQGAVYRLTFADNNFWHE